MSETRLELISLQLRKRLDSASEEQLRHIAAPICMEIIRRTGVSDPVISEALEHLSQKKTPPADLQARVQFYAQKLDADYLDLTDELEEESATQEQVAAAFSQARAANAVAFALSANAIVAASETTYEAASAVADDSEMTGIVEKILDGKYAG